MSEHRRIAYVLKRFPRISETFVAAELIELERQGESVAVFAISRPEEPLEHGFLAELRAPVTYLPRRPWRQPLRVVRALLRVARRNPGGWLAAARLSLRPPRLLLGLRRLLQATVLTDELDRAGVDHAHVHFANVAARLAQLSLRMGGPGYSVTAHAKDIYHRDVLPERLREKLADARFVATVSRDNQRFLRALLGDDNSHCLVLPNSVDLRRLHANGDQTSERTLVVSVARLIEKKGLTDLVDACGLLAGRGVRLELVGVGPQRTQLEAHAAAAGARVLFRQALPQEQVIELLRRATVFCLPCIVSSDGDRDGLPTSVLEAMAVGVPVVTTALNGLADAVEHDRTGLIVPPHDPPAIAAAIARLLEDPQLARALALQARRQVERHFCLERNASHLRELFPEPA